nr:methyltransferase type 11 [uncultured bacterium]
MSTLLEQSEKHEAQAARERVAYYSNHVSPGSECPTLLLDVGCGNGYAVREWRARGVEAFGVDCSLYRMSRWVVEHPTPIPLVVSDATALPFRDGGFDVVLSSGMIEHVGVDESSSPYTIHPRPEKSELRLRAIKEMVRATSESGRVLIDFPNGSFPIDFWHGDNVGAFRVHAIPDVLLPSFGDLRKWARSAQSRAVVLPLAGRLKFRQVGRHLWGRLGSPLMRIAIRTLDVFSRAGLGRFVAPLYPYLVVEVRREPHA